MCVIGMSKDEAMKKYIEVIEEQKVFSFSNMSVPLELKRCFLNPCAYPACRRSMALNKMHCCSDDANMSATIMIPRGGIGGKSWKFSRWCDVTSIFNTNDGTPAGIVISL